MNKIIIKNLQKKRINQVKLKKLASRTLRHQGIEGAEVSVLLVDNTAIRKLNKQYLKKDRPTDVIAFRMQDGKFSDLNPNVLGDVVVSVEKAQICAREIGNNFEYELSMYLVHGLLHLAGYSDKTKSGFLKMKRIQEEILEKNA
ncbi:MAG: rRNA maturation RNase YbeY [PVC group bacterium]|nr:rRNA maturation RNase YbeY [PVC group bacterium]